MAFAATTEWDVQTTGSDAAGGGFDTASTGTDRSQGAVFQAYTDIVIDATTNTKISSAAHPFDATSVGNIINITGGTGFTVQRVQIISQVAGLATCDKAVGTTSSTGGTGNLGGSLLTWAKAITSGLLVNANIVHVKAGTYTITSGMVTDSISFQVIGYQTTHNDGGTKPLLTTATNSVKLIAVTLANTTFTNISFSNTAAVRADGLWFNGTNNTQGLIVVNCLFDGFVVGINGDNGVGGAGGLTMSGTEVKNCSSHGVVMFFGSAVHGCYLHNNTGDGYQANNQGTHVFTNVIFTSNGARGLGIASTVLATLANCTIASNTGDGIGAAGAQVSYSIRNVIIYANGGWGINVLKSPSSNTKTFLEINTAFGGPNVSGNRLISGSTPTLNVFGDITLTASPFTGSPDYSLNSTAGGGTLCKLAAFPGIFPGGGSTANLDVGAVQTSGGAGSSNTYIISPTVVMYTGEEN